MNIIKFSKDARNDLIDIYSYIKYRLQEPDIANKLIQKIEKEIYKLEFSPTIYSIIDDDFIKKLEIRKFKVNNYIIFYKFNEERKVIEIIRIKKLVGFIVSLLKVKQGLTLCFVSPCLF